MQSQLKFEALKELSQTMKKKKIKKHQGHQNLIMFSICHTDTSLHSWKESAGGFLRLHGITYMVFII